MVGFDELPQTLELVEEGVIAGTLSQAPERQSYEAVRMLLDGAEEDLLAEHWDGPPEVLEVFDDMVGWAADLVPRRVRWALNRVAAR